MKQLCKYQVASRLIFTSMMSQVKGLSQGVIFYEACSAILLLGDIKLENVSITVCQNVFTDQTFVTNLHLLRVELRCKLQEKLHRVTGS